MDPSQIKSTAKFDHDGTFYSVAIDGSGSRLFAGSSDYDVHVFDLSRRADAKNQPVARWQGHDNYVSALGFVKTMGDSMGGSSALVVSGSFDRQLIWWNPDSGEQVRQIEAHEGWVRDLAVFPDSSRIATVGDDMLVKVWDARTGEPIHALAGHAKQTPQGHVTALYEVTVSDDGTLLATADRHGEVRIWEADSGKLLQTLAVPVLYTYDPRQRKRSIGGIRALAFSAEGRRLAVGGVGQIENVDGLGGPATMELWDWQAGQRLVQSQPKDLSGFINHLAFHPQTGWLIGAGGGSNGFLVVWETARDEPVASTAGTSGTPAGPTDVGKHTETQSTEEASDDPKANGELAAHTFTTDGHLHQFALSPSGTELYAAGYGKLETWSLG